MTYKNKFWHWLILTLAISCNSWAADTEIDFKGPYDDETVQQRDSRMAWWREAKFGLFIHWGVYSVPAGTYKGQQIENWEACQTMNTTWGYKSYDDDWKSSKQLIHNLVDVASKGGNYLLNVGPMSTAAYVAEVTTKSNGTTATIFRLKTVI